jgi:hypothetical protein
MYSRRIKGTMIPSYYGPGDYLAICPNSWFTTIRVIPFTIPNTPELANVNANWYFLNVVDGVSCLIAALPASKFKEALSENTPCPNPFLGWPATQGK